MLFVDYRTGSRELIKPLQDLGLPVEETTLEFGDVAFAGRGAGGTPLSIGIEFKKLPELIQSMRSGRLHGYQMIGMSNAYDWRWLLIEGELIYDTTGRLMRRSGRLARDLKPYPGRMTVGEFLKRLHVMQMCGGLTPMWAKDRRTTLTQIQMLYRVWTDVDLDEHKSYLTSYTPPSLVPLSTMRDVLQRLPEVGQAVSLAAQKRFRSIRRAVNAPASEWAELALTDRKGHTRRFGTKAATLVEEALTHEHG